MPDPNQRPDANPDSPPRSEDRGSVESLDQIDGHDHAEDDIDGTPDAGTGAVGGTDGIVKNQDDTAQ